MSGKLHSINRAQRLYVIEAGRGYVSCLGFDVAHRRTSEVAAWLDRAELAPPARRGTLKAWRAYQVAMEAGADHHRRTGERCTAELTPALIGLEGRRVEVSGPDGSRRFWVGKSTGWSPCHLEIARRDSTGGGAVYIGAGESVRVISNERR